MYHLRDMSTKSCDELYSICIHENLRNYYVQWWCLRRFYVNLRKITHKYKQRNYKQQIIEHVKRAFKKKGRAYASCPLPP